jgi:methylenetetrahydrofolate reductase (NADPH)
MNPSFNKIQMGVTGGRAAWKAAADAGADAVQTQPIFDKRYFEFMDVARERGLNIPVLVGVLPLRGEQDAVDIERRYGITIPTETKVRLRRNGEQVGQGLARELTTSLIRQGVRALHIYPREDCGTLISLVEAAEASGDFH